jgi:hypothetical protein
MYPSPVQEKPHNKRDGDQIETTRSLLLCGFSCTGDGYMTMISYRDQIETTRSLLFCGFSCTGDGYMTIISSHTIKEIVWFLFDLCKISLSCTHSLYKISHTIKEIMWFLLWSLLLCGFSCTGDGYMTMISYRDQIETTQSLLLCGFSCTGDGYMTMISYRD